MWGKHAVGSANDIVGKQDMDRLKFMGRARMAQLKEATKTGGVVQW